MRNSDSRPTHERTGLNRRDFLACTAAGAVCAGHPIQPASADGERAVDRNTGPCSPLAMWALTGTLRSADVLRQLDAYRDVGWGVVLYPRWGLELEYLGGAWFDRIRFIVEQADARAMEVWLYDEFCRPSGHAKGLVTQGRADLEAELLLVDRDGQNRTVRVPGSANLLMSEATQRFLQVTHERYAEAIGPFFGRCVRAIFTDEPSLAMYHRPPAKGSAVWQLPWSKAMDTALGEDFRKRLAAVDDVSRWSGWRDYWAAYSQVFHDAWVSPIAHWCKSHGIALTGHLLGEGGFGSQVAYNGSPRRQLGAFGIPGIDEIHTRTDPAKSEALTLAAIAEFEGRERMVEAYALGPPDMTLDTMRKMVDLCSACGVDRYVMAICPHDLRGGVFKREYLGIHGPQQPWFRDFARVFTDHVAEAAQIASQAKPLGVPWPSDEELWAAAGPDPKPLKFLPALILWGNFAVDREGRLIEPRETIPRGDWRKHGYPALCGTGRYRAVAEFETPPTHLTVDTGGYPTRVTMNGKDAGLRAWSPFRVDLRNAAKRGHNEIVVEVTSTLGHLFVPSESSPVGLLAATLEF